MRGYTEGMRDMAAQYASYAKSPRFRAAFLFSLALFAFGIAVNFFAGLYATVRASNYVEDIVLSNIPVVDVSALFVVGTFVIIGFVLVLLLARPHWMPFTLCSLGIFYSIRAVFITLTHLGPFPGRIEVADWGTIVANFIGGNDMFFSGHTGAPFLLALIFWHTRPLRYVFFAWSVMFAVVVLLGHVHYSIDVLSAFFITYAIFALCEHLFSNYRKLFYSGLPALEK
jgi:hypothetical protein